MSIQDKKRRKKKKLVRQHAAAGLGPPQEGTCSPPPSSITKPNDRFMDGPEYLIPSGARDHVRVHYDHAYARWPTRPNTDRPVIWLP